MFRCVVFCAELRPVRTDCSPTLQCCSGGGVLGLRLFHTLQRLEQHTPSLRLARARGPDEHEAVVDRRDLEKLDDLVDPCLMLLNQYGNVIIPDRLLS